MGVLYHQKRGAGCLQRQPHPREPAGRGGGNRPCAAGYYGERKARQGFAFYGALRRPERRAQGRGCPVPGQRGH